MKNAIIESTVIESHDLMLLKFGCDNKARHSIVIRKNRLGDKTKNVYRLCDKHFKRLKEAEPSEADRQPFKQVVERMIKYGNVKNVYACGTYEPRFTFRHNRL